MVKTVSSEFRPHEGRRRLPEFRRLIPDNPEDLCLQYPFFAREFDREMFPGSNGLPHLPAGALTYSYMRRDRNPVAAGVDAGIGTFEARRRGP